MEERDDGEDEAGGGEVAAMHRLLEGFPKGEGIFLITCEKTLLRSTLIVQSLMGIQSHSISCAFSDDLVFLFS